MGKVNLKKMLRKYEEYQSEQDNRKKFIIIDDGDDVIFNLGGKLSDWKGSKVSDMVTDHEGRRVLNFVIQCGSFDEEVVDIIIQKLDEVYL